MTPSTRRTRTSVVHSVRRLRSAYRQPSRRVSRDSVIYATQKVATQKVNQEASSMEPKWPHIVGNVADELEQSLTTVITNKTQEVKDRIDARTAESTKEIQAGTAKVLEG